MPRQYEERGEATKRSASFSGLGVSHQVTSRIYHQAPGWADLGLESEFGEGAHISVRCEVLVLGIHLENTKHTQKAAMYRTALKHQENESCGWCRRAWLAASSRLLCQVPKDLGLLVKFEEFDWHLR